MADFASMAHELKRASDLFSLSLGERAGVRASVISKLISKGSLQ
jgi:hypothetical protein